MTSIRDVRHVISLDIEGDSSDIRYFTSHDDIATPDEAKTIHNCVRTIPVRSQGIDPAYFQFTVGTGSIELVDIDGAVTSLLATKFTSDTTVRKKLISFYSGVRGMYFSDYDLIAVQLVDNEISVTDDIYTLGTADLQYTMRSKIFPEVKTTLSANVNSSQTYVHVNDPSDFDTLAHDTQFSHLPSTTVGYLSIISNKAREKIAWLNKLDTAVSILSATDISFATSDDSINSTSSDLSVFSAGQAIEIHNSANNNVVVTGTNISFSSTDNSISSASSAFGSFSVGQIIDLTGSTSNDGAYTIIELTAAKIKVAETITTEAAGDSVTINSRSIFVIATVTSSKLTLTENIVDESAGTSISLVANPQFYNCIRGVLNTRAITHTVDLTASVDRRTAVTQWMYLETNGLKMAHSILTGTMYGTANSLPTGWGLGISSSYIETTQFTAMADLWDTSDDSGFILRFEGEKEQDARKFLFEQVLFPLGVFQRVLNSGKLGVKRFNRVITGASAVGQVTQSDIIGTPSLKFALKDVVNLFRIDWNWDADEQKFTRKSPVLDLTSTNKYEAGDIKLTYGLRGVHGSIHTFPIVFGIADMIRDRYSSYPKRLVLTCLPGHSGYQVGDVIRVTLDNVKDHTGSTQALDSAFEVQQKQYNPTTGQATYVLFGSSEAATPLAHYTGNVLPDSYYTSEGTDIKTVLTTGSSAGGTYTVTGAATLTGNADLTNTAAIYYCNENLTIAAGVDIPYTNNVQIRVLGQLTVNGSFNGKGNGHSGGSGATLNLETFGTNYYGANSGTSGFIGDIQSGGGWFTYPYYGIGQNGGKFYTNRMIESTRTEGAYDTLPYFPLVNTGSTLTGLPTDLRGTSGGSGGPVSSEPFSNANATLSATGGAGGASGAGLLVVARGMSFGANGSIDCSGDEGSTGGSYTNGNGQTLYAGSGAPGYPGVVWVIIDNVASNVPDNNVIADIVQPRTQGYPATPEGPLNVADSSTEYPAYSFLGTATVDASPSVFRWQYAPKSETAEEDVNTTAETAVSITSTDGAATVNTPNRIMVAMSATPPIASGNYSYSNIYVKESTNVEWTFVGRSATVDDTVEFPMKVSTTYDIKAHAVSLDGTESVSYISDTHTTGGQSFSIATAATSAQSIQINTTTHELEFYGDRGDTTIELLATIGVSTEGSDNVIGYFGSANYSGGHAIYCKSTDTSSTIYGNNLSSGPGVYGASDSGHGVGGFSTSGAAFWAVKGGVLIQEQTTTVANPTTSAQVNIYMRGDKIIFAFDDAGTMRYKYLDLTGTGVTWVHTTTAPT